MKRDENNAWISPSISMHCLNLILNLIVNIMVQDSQSQTASSFSDSIFSIPVLKSETFLTEYSADEVFLKLPFTRIT